VGGEIFGRDVVLALAGGTVLYRYPVLFGPGSQTAAEAPRDAYEMVVVELASEP
jgi:hypothetical protein